METASVRVLVVEDSEPWCAFLSTTLGTQTDLQVVGWVSDGLEAVQQSQQLQPDLILLDIGLPTLNGIAAARRIREVAPASKILFLSDNRDLDIVRVALSTGARGYVVKSDAGSDLLPGVNAILENRNFVSATLAHGFMPLQAHKKIRHEVEFYSDDAEFVDGFARFIEAALMEGIAVLVVATKSHHAALLQRLNADGLNMTGNIEEGTYIRLEAADTLSNFMVDESPDPTLFNRMAGNLITKAARGAKGEQRRVAVCGEGVHILLASGNVEAAISLEGMWNEIAKHYELEILCGYFRSAFACDENVSTLERVCAEHSAVHGRETCC